MKKSNNIFLALLILVLLPSCNAFRSDGNPEQADASAIFQNNIVSPHPLHADGDVNAVIEIPAGTLEKWELDKMSGKIVRDSIDGKPRTIKYLGYPGNYGFIPETLLSKEEGGDGDPLDILIIGPPVERGSVVKCKIIGVLYLLDRGEQDDKLIAISTASPMYTVNSLAELNNKYNAMTEILQLWFTNYKGPGMMVSRGFGDSAEAIEILIDALEEYDSRK